MPLIECVPNVSEGRRADWVAAVAASLRRSGVTVLDRTSDPSHHRSVFTLAGSAESLRSAVLSLSLIHI